MATTSHRVVHFLVVEFRDDLTADQIAEFYGVTLAGLKQSVPGILSFSWGPYSSAEGLNKHYKYGSTMIFVDEAARDVYLEHPAHEVVKNELVAMLKDGLNSIVVFDYLLDNNNEF